jgi:cytoskeleton protein RodZ
MAGESFDLPALPPVFVVIGRVDVTEVMVRGKPFNLLEVSKENVARFEVK